MGLEDDRQSKVPREVKDFGKLMRSLSQTFHELGENARKTAFSLLDYRLSETPLEDRPARSWEIEREEFLRRLDAGCDD